ASDIPGIGSGVGDPSVVVCQRTNRIWVVALAAPKSGHPIWKSVPGSTSPENCGQLILAHSDDEGLTWSKPINITESVKRLKDSDTKDWGCLFNGPGNGLSMRNGTLVFAGQIWGEKHQGVLVYSKDRGKTWTSSKAMSFGGSESQVVELSDGSLLMNTREGISGLRQVGHTKDLGETWTQHPSARSKQGKLYNSFCQAGTISLFNPQGKNGRSPYNLGKGVNHALFFSAPAAWGRSMMRLRYSLDDGNSWSEGLLYDQRKCMGYSAITPVDRDNIGVLYESESGFLYFLKIPFSEVLSIPLQK
ncbi:MAG: sialidase family protein, partial [Lentisphaeria bacterium]